MKYLLVVLTIFVAAVTAIPNAIFHGLGDNCKDNKKHLVKGLHLWMLGEYTECIQIGSGSITSIIMSLEKQAELACEQINLDP